MLFPQRYYVIRTRDKQSVRVRADRHEVDDNENLKLFIGNGEVGFFPDFVSWHIEDIQGPSGEGAAAVSEDVFKDTEW